MRRLILLTILFTLPAALSAADSSVASPDTVLVDDLVVLGDAGGAADPSDVALSASALEAVTPWNAGDLEALLPATSITVNSRGESLLMIRGAPERHVTVTLDGIPLTVPWDERADLSLVPLDGVASLRATRGASSLLAGPNGVAGSLELRTGGAGPRTRLSFQAAQGSDFGLRAAHRSDRGAWDWLAAASLRDRDHNVLPDGVDTPFNQTDPDARNNTDLRQASALLRGVRHFDDGGRLSVLMLGSDAERGVAPETHIADARFWRLPMVRRGLAGLRLERPVGERWEVDASLAVDAFAQDIQAYDDAGYDTLDGAPEEGRDLTGHARLLASRQLRGLSRVDFLAQLRLTRHRERLEVDGPQFDYSQRLASVAAEWSLLPDAPWTLRLGLGIDAAATPSTGDKPSRGGSTAPAVLARYTHDVGHAGQAHMAVSQRSRFPALRELFSGALGRFVPNPDLAPERQTLAEAGYATRGAGWEAGLTVFAARLDDGIEKSSLGDGRFMRVNRGRIMTGGVELVASRRLGRGLSVGLHHSLLNARVDDGEGTDERPAEDRPSHQGSLLGEWRSSEGWHLSVVGNWIGERSSADASDAVDGLTDLQAGMWWDAWVGRSFDRGASTEVELRIGVRNITDEAVWEQVGLVGAGRSFVASLGLSRF